jgi:hypothetical protein
LLTDESIDDPNPTDKIVCGVQSVHNEYGV